MRKCTRCLSLARPQASRRLLPRKITGERVCSDPKKKKSESDEKNKKRKATATKKIKKEKRKRRKKKETKRKKVLGVSKRVEEWKRKASPKKKTNGPRDGEHGVFLGDVDCERRE
jgi:hypothetical protein